MEELLNKLIEKGWKLRGKDQKFEIWIENLPYKKLRVCLKKPDYDYYVYSYRDLVSKESGLWQFVCENGMVDGSNFYTREKVDEDRDWIDVTYSTIAEGKKGGHYEYRLIESALCDEDKLEDFLLNNIKIDE